MSDELVSKIKSRFDHATQKKLLREKYSSKLTFAHAGGMWKASPELATQCNLCLANGNFNPVFEDLYSTPVKVDAEELKNLTLQRWQEQMNAWLDEHEELSKQR